MRRVLHATKALPRGWTDREGLHFSFAITPPGAASFNLELQKKPYWDE